MRLGLIGSDSDAQLRAECYAAVDDVTVTGVVTEADPRPDWPSAEIYPDVETLLADAGVAAVDIRDRTRPLRPVVEQCLDAGVDVVCRTPVGDDPEEAAAIRDLVKGSDGDVIADARHRFVRENRDAKSVVDDGDLGTPTTVHTTRRIPAVETLDIGASTADGVANLDLSSDTAVALRRALYPDVARIRWLLGDVERVFTRLRRGDGASGDYCHAVAVARLASGAVAHLTLSYGDRHDKVSVVAEYSGTRGRYTYDSEAFVPLSVRSKTDIETGISGTFERSRPSLDVHRRHVDSLVEALRGRADPPESLSEATETLRAVHAATESARRGAPVSVAGWSA